MYVMKLLDIMEAIGILSASSTIDKRVCTGNTAEKFLNQSNVP